MSRLFEMEGRTSVGKKDDRIRLLERAVQDLQERVDGYEEENRRIGKLVQQKLTYTKPNGVTVTATAQSLLMDLRNSQIGATYTVERKL